MRTLHVKIQHSLGAFELNLDHHFAPGITAIVGPSGAGKTSLLRHIAGLEHAQKSTITLGDEVWQENAQHLSAQKRQVAMVFQSPKLLPHFNVAKNIFLKPSNKRSNISQHNGLMQQLGIEHLLNRKPAKLSGGERQRVMLARALVADPKTLLFDEPLSALAPDQRRALGQLIKQTSTALNIPVLFVTHSFEEAARLADRFVYLDQGQIIAHGTMQDVFTQLAAQNIMPQELIEYGLGAELHGKPVPEKAQEGLLAIDIEGQFLKVPQSAGMPLNNAQVHIWARDVILSQQPHQGLSTRNCLKVRIDDIVPSNQQSGPVLVRLGIGAQRFYATITHQALDELDLKTNQPIYALIKSIALEPQALIDKSAPQ